MQSPLHAEHSGASPEAEKTLASELKSIWLAPDDNVARKRANALIDKYESRYPQAIKCLEEALEDSLVFYSYPELDKIKGSSGNMIERLNRETGGTQA